MSGNCSQDLPPLLPESAKSRLSITAKNDMKNSCDENLKTCDLEVQSFDILEKETGTRNKCELQSCSVRSNAEMTKVNSKFPDTESPKHAVRKEMLNSMLEFTDDEDDLLCKISMAQNEISVDTEE